MTEDFLLDTCVVSDIFKKVPSVLNRLKEISPIRIHISAITVMEIEYGLQLNPERGRKIQPIWREFLKNIRVLPYTPRCALSSASIRANLKNRGQPIGPYDLLLGGTAIAYVLVFVTSNCKEFDRIPQLKIEDWRREITTGIV